MNEINLPQEDKLKKLEIWAMQNSVDPAKLDNVKAMIHTGSRGTRKPNDPMQFPDYYYPDKFARDFHRAEEYPWVKTLENAWPDIKNEALAIFGNNLMSLHPQNDDLANDGTWKTFFFYKNGVKFENNMALCPHTATVID